MEQAPSDFFTSKKAIAVVELKRLKRKIRRFGWYRLLAFLMIFAPLVASGWQGWITAGPMIFFGILFFLLIKKSVRLEREKKFFEAQKKIAEDELLALEHQFSHFDNGGDFLDKRHFYSHDLDIFGENAVFQYINRTSTQSGRWRLAGLFNNPPLEKEEIRERQEAIRELSDLPEWRINFLVRGHLFRETLELSDEIKAWAGTRLELRRPQGIRWSIRLLPPFTLLAMIPAVVGFSWMPFVVLLFTQLGLLFFSRKRVDQYYRFFGRKSELLGKYRQLLEFVEAQNFQSAYLKHLQGKVCRPDRASHIFQQLKKWVGRFEYRQNLLVALVLNSIFLWDIRCVYQLWQWHGRNRNKLVDWLGVIAEMDALVSLANFACNHPRYAYPAVKDDGFTFRAKQLGHPLLPPGKRVCNDFAVNGWSNVVIVTGANMAGKSTFLRTVGVNLVLARLGAPVCAREMAFTPVKVYTDMRTTDSLLGDESYFFAELKRIKGVLERLEKGERIFVILDEMLKGTNSVDKLNGSRALIRKLLRLQAVALIATHDLKLSEMEKEHAGRIWNKCFEIRIKGNEQLFDYHLSDGVTQTMNATFLMKKMGIV